MMIPLGVMGAAHRSAVNLSAAILALSPAGYWKLTETSGTTATDYSGNARHGSYSGSYTLNAVNGLPTFSGGYVQVADNDAWTVGSGLTIFALIRCTGSVGARRFAVSKGAASNYEWGIEDDISNRLEVSAWSLPGQVQMSEVAPSDFPTNTWRALAVALPPVTYQTRFPVYMSSSTALATTQGAISSGSAGNGTAPLCIGQRGDNVGPWAGQIGHVAIFPGQLSAAQVGTLMAAAAAEGF